ncbi:OB-fold domain-containing protein [Bartonella sp. AA89HNZF]|uniref:OB-fold domain-containing protein n=1 Tax=Bartonella sp. AA89HNZF TaxID=3243442 RepID=UPI0035D1186F
MIGTLKGTLEHIFDDHILLDVYGVSYVVFVLNWCMHYQSIDQSYQVRMAI